ncbi:MAG: ferredoxin [Firmicutes bacterium HGW-Firmicutes-3]|jgi:iron only hydrogenase large subunit-like protein|nr:MAG: ferredoxin [Firmicutes bacterium HGW-Firmicutes-3]
MGNYHSVTLDKNRCIGCTDCIKRCPTEAIRVRHSKAEITDDLCIDCGMCIRVCKSQAKRALTDSLDKINKFKYKVAIPAPTLYTQFKKLRDPNIVLTALKKIGFDEVFEVAKAAEVVTAYSQKLLEEGKINRPVISSACPAIVKLIQMRFPSLIDNVMPIISPKEAIARYARQYLIDQGLESKDIGIFFITPCAAKVTNSRQPQTIKTSDVDGVISMKDIYLELIPVINKLQPEDIEILQMSSANGIGWAASGGEGLASKVYNLVAVDGIENVITILERVENNKLDVDFIECLACVNGCLGGPLTVENSFVSTNRMGKIKKYVKQQGKTRDLNIINPKIRLKWDYGLEVTHIRKLDDNMMVALTKMEQIDDLHKTLPRIDCGSCGAPTCKAFAEDVVRGDAIIEDCIFMLREKVRSMAEEMMALSGMLPPSIDQNRRES